MHDDAYNRECVAYLVSEGERLLAEQRYPQIPFSKNEAVDELLSDLEHYPHAFVLACMMHRQVEAECAWRIPHLVSVELGDFEFSTLLAQDSATIRDIFARERLLRYNTKMAKNFCAAVRRIHDQYNGDASNIWKGTLPSATLVPRLLEFRGVDIKIATMAANILVRDFKVPVADKRCIDISPDVQVKRVFRRLGLIGPSRDYENEELMYCARGLNPDYPGVFGLPAWEIGRQWCKRQKPVCSPCDLEDLYCPKVGVNDAR